MSELKKILIATDFSKKAEYALLRASKLAHKNKTKLNVLHVFPESLVDKASEWFSNTVNKQFLRFKREANKAFKNKIKPALGDLKTTFTVKMGRENETIVKYAKNNKFNLLVIGAHGNYSLNEYLLGTTAESIVKHAPCPTLIVKRKPHLRYHKILVPIDFSLTSQKALRFAYEHFPKSSIELLYVDDLWYDKSTYRPSLPKKRRAILQEQLHKIIKNNIYNFLKKVRLIPRRLHLLYAAVTPHSLLPKK